MKKIIAYLGIIGLIDIFILVFLRIGKFPTSWIPLELITTCFAIGGLGGVVYCLRGIYLNYCVQKTWDDQWQPWYYIRPVVSHICGAVSYLFLRAGLLLLEAQPTNHSTELGFMALAFIAGLNVDKFITKIEDIAQATWGIEKSRISKRDN